jgi:hypothetical protein
MPSLQFLLSLEIITLQFQKANSELILADSGLVTLMWEELVNALPKVVGSLRVLRFPPTGNVNRVGWD